MNIKQCQITWFFIV